VREVEEEVADERPVLHPQRRHGVGTEQTGADSVQHRGEKPEWEEAEGEEAEILLASGLASGGDR